MLHIRQADLPHIGSSHNFVGADRGDVGVSGFLFNGTAGNGGPLSPRFIQENLPLP